MSKVMRSVISSVMCLALALLLTRPLAAAELKKVAEVEGISEYRLDNGMKILLFPDASKPTVTVNLTIFVGSRHEGYGETGMAHLLEHMLFKGTPTNKEIDKSMQARGASFNGTTWLDRTNYYETMPASDENTEFAIKLEADRMMNSMIRGEDLASEMTVVRNEFERGEDSPSRILSQRVHAAAYEWHNYGKTTIGNRSDIERVPLPRLRAFYRKYYQPDNAMLIVAGKFDKEKTLGWIKESFGAIPAPERELEKTYTDEPAQDGERSVVLRRVGDVGLVSVAYHIPAGAHEDFSAIRVLAYILAMEPAGRLYKNLIETKMATAVSGYAYGLHDPGLIEMEAEVRRDGSLQKVRTKLLETIEEIGKDGVTDEEVKRAKAQILKAREMELANSTRLAVSLSNWAAQGDWRLYFLYRDRVEKVTADDVKRVAAKYLVPNNRTVGLFIPTKEAQRVAIPHSLNVEELVRDYKGREAIAAGEQFDPSPENIAKRTTRSQIEGVKVALLPKKTRGEMVSLRLTLRYGDESTLQGMNTAMSVLPQLMTRGTKEMTHQQIQDALDKHRATLGGSGGRGMATFSIRAKRDTLPDVVAILQQVLREPTLPEDELEVMRREQLAQLEASKTSPQMLAITKLRQTLSPYPKDSLLYVPSVEESIERLKNAKLKDIQTLYQNFLGAQAGELVIVGDFDPDSVMPLLKETLSGWESKYDYERIPDPANMMVEGGSFQIQIPDKSNAVLYAGERLKLNDTNADYPALLIGNSILGGSSLASRLGDRVRQKEGLSYGIGSGIRAHPIDENGSFTVGAISNPQNMPKVVVAVKEEVEKLLKDGVTQTELDRAKKGFLQEQKLGRSTDGGIAGILSGLLFVDREMQYYIDLEAKVASLTGEEIVEALRRHINPKRIVFVTAGDFESAKSDGAAATK